MDKEQPNYYLIKRNSVFSEYRNIKKINSKAKKYSESIISSKNQFPASIKLKENDIIFVSESGIGIYAKAIVTQTKSVVTSNSLDEIIKTHNINAQAKYWCEKLSKFQEKKAKDDKVKFKYHEYVVNQTLLNSVVPFQSENLERFIVPGFAHVFIKLNEIEVNAINDPKRKTDTVFQEKIPGKLKFDIHSIINRDEKSSHWIDIDHLVPKSIGGPGNIIENLVPIGSGLNRFKSNSIPKEFLIVSKEKMGWKFDSEIENIIKNDSDELVKLNSSKNLHTHCKLINKKVKKLKFDDAKDFYFEILKRKYPNLSEIYAKYR